MIYDQATKLFSDENCQLVLYGELYSYNFFNDQGITHPQRLDLDGNVKDTTLCYLVKV